MTSKDKKDFDWKEGAKLKGDDYDALGDVRTTGFTKLADGIYADPEARKKARTQKLNKAPKIKDGEFIFEETESGLSGNFTPTNAEKYLKKEGKFKGIRQFDDTSVSGSYDKIDKTEKSKKP
ncbi:hypothetical protein K1X76_00170 [bacterium]|nr:hypothetical protein [bacterium]